MAYITRYNNFIESLKDQEVSGVYEKHHIVPKSMGGTDDATNLIKLTPRQHYIAHWMLWKAYGGKMAQAFWCMNNTKGRQINSRSYARLREEAINNFSGENSYWYGKKHSTESKKLQSERRKQFLENNPEKKEQIRKQLTSIVITPKMYEKQAKVISSLVWMNDGIRSYRVRPELVNDRLNSGLIQGRLMSFIHDKEYKMNQKIKTTQQWQKIKAAGFSNLKGSE